MLAKTDADAVRVHNRLAVIDALRRFGSATRKELSAATGLSVSAASAIAADLLRTGVLIETEDAAEGEARRGRPGRRLVLNGAATGVAAARIAVGEMEIRLCDYRGETIGAARWEGSIAAMGGDELVRQLAQLLEEATQTVARTGTTTSAGADTAAAGVAIEPFAPIEAWRPARLIVAVQGKTDSDGRRIVWSPALKARDLDLAGQLAARLDTRVGVFNDCSLMPEAFRWTPDFVGRDFAILFIGFGVGMGVRLGGRTFQGQRSSAVEFGHINHIPGGALCRCGNRGCIEAYAGDYAIWRRAHGRPDEITTRRIPDEEIGRLVARARSGDAEAIAAFAEAGTAIGYGLGRMFTLVDPLPVVVVGAGAQAMDLMEPEIRAGIRASAIEGDGADIALSHGYDVDELIFAGAAARALGSLDDDFARAGGVSQGEPKERAA